MTDISLSKIQLVNYVRLFVFLVIAYGVSNIFRFNIFEINDALGKSFTWSYLIIEGSLEGTGILLPVFWVCGCLKNSVRLAFLSLVLLNPKAY
ncbi:MAG: hypothetical protein IPK08_02875 [Bacteroidetes bacterium]|nr:hypothetical protein [Bacteroidota bacterium]